MIRESQAVDTPHPVNSGSMQCGLDKAGAFTSWISLNLQPLNHFVDKLI